MKSTTRTTLAVILAAGKGTRMKSELPKVIHPILGRPMVSYIIDACKKAGIQRLLLVIGHRADLVQETLGPNFEYVHQTQQLGTGHALMMVSESLRSFKGDLLVLAGDTPLLTGSILKKLINKHKKTTAAATMMTAVLDPTPAYGRIVRDNVGRVQYIVEDRDASREEKKIKEVNTSHYCFRTEKILPLLTTLDSDNDQGEYYLTDIIHMLASRNEIIETLTSDDPGILMGINSRIDLANVKRTLQQDILNKAMRAGVTITDPSRVTIQTDVKIGIDTTIRPDTILEGKTVIGKGCTIGPGVRLKNARIGDNTSIEFTVIENRKIESNAVIGPFAFLTGD